MKIAVLKETAEGETRCAAIPETMIEAMLFDYGGSAREPMTHA